MTRNHLISSFLVGQLRERFSKEPMTVFLLFVVKPNRQVCANCPSLRYPNCPNLDVFKVSRSKTDLLTLKKPFPKMWCGSTWRFWFLGTFPKAGGYWKAEKLSSPHRIILLFFLLSSVFFNVCFFYFFFLATRFNPLEKLQYENNLCVKLIYFAPERPFKKMAV